MPGFDFESLVNNPQFQMGIGLLGAANPTRNKGLLDAYRIMSANTMQQAKLKEEASQRAMEEQKIKLYGRQVEGQETANDLKRLELKRQEEADQQWTQTVTPLLLQQAQRRWGGGVQPQPGQPAPTPQQQLDSIPEPDFFEQRILPIESGDDAKTGRMRTSPKGAIGPAQIVPDTAPKAAQIAGVPFDDYKYRNDPKYNIQIGKALFNHYATEQYGNLPMAAAAYNAGEGALARAMDRAKKLGNEGMWLSFMPPETRAYVQKATGGWNGGPIPPSLSGKSYIENLQREKDEYNQMRMTLGALIGRTDRKAGVTMIADALKPDMEIPKLVLQERGVVNDERRTDISAKAEDRQQAQEDRIAEEKKRERQAEQSKAELNVTQYDQQMETAAELANRLRNHPGLKYISGRFAGSLPAPLLPREGMEALSIYKQLRGINFIGGTLAIRNASPTGAGVGNQSNQEGDKLESSQARLERFMDTEDLKKALEEFENLSRKSQHNVRRAYEKGWGTKLELPEVRNGTREHSGEVMDLNDYIRRKKEGK